MNGDILSGGLVFAVGAVLWVAYLIPSWLRRRHFAETEANAVRLKHTVAALTAAGLETNHLRSAEESARALHEQRKALRRVERHSKKRARSVAHENLTAAQRALLARHRRRRQRQAAFSGLLISLATIAAGVALTFYVGDIVLVVVGAVGSTVSLIVVSSLSAPARVRAPQPARQSAEAFDQGEAPRAVAPTWTPRQLPRPLHLEPGSTASATLAQQRAGESRRRALAEQAFVATQTPARITPVMPAASVAAAPATQRAPSMYADLGRVAEVDAETFDLDSALRRRRAV
ncbi:MAG: hypothetical protein F2808_03835 [Actinobacteria bacterium]|uniref:Unannotated protein n=1 Tax=freshwater metagenome TaxID=449393 RepID=A0A6J7G061_9ZZZZ|nr:hypothetical protein [Actinomycetota bacterium]